MSDSDDVIAFVRADYTDPALAKRFQPPWVRLLDGERVLTPHQSNAWVMDVEKAEEVAEQCNADPHFQKSQWVHGDFKSEPHGLLYSVVKYKLMESA